MANSELLADGYNLIPPDALVSVDHPSFSRVLVDNSEGFKTPPIEKCVGNKIHRPAIVPVGDIGTLQTMC